MTALLAAGIALLAGVTTAAGLVHGTAAAVITFALLAVLLTVLSLTVRYLVVVGAGQAKPRLFYIREASFPVDAEDRLFDPEAGNGSHLNVVPPKEVSA
jgi:hypothetical protein